MDSSQVQAKPGHACKLHKSLYGTKQAREIWGSLQGKQLKEWGFKNFEYDNRIYFYVTGSEFAMLAIVVDDLAFSSNSSSLLLGFKSKLDANFDVDNIRKVVKGHWLEHKPHELWNTH